MYTSNKAVALVLLVLIFFILGWSVFCMVQARFEEAVVMFPLLIIFYVFVVSRRRDDKERRDNREDTVEPDDTAGTESDNGK